MARASALQAEGRRFDSDYLHKKALKVFPECFFVCMVFYRKCFLFCPHYSVSRIGLRHPIIYVISVHGLAPAFAKLVPCTYNQIIEPVFRDKVRRSVSVIIPDLSDNLHNLQLPACSTKISLKVRPPLIVSSFTNG